MSIDYKKTVCYTDRLPHDRLPKREPELLQRWVDIDLWGKMRAASKAANYSSCTTDRPTRTVFAYRPRPQQILKDVINRSQQMMGKDANYVLGWDCHGLPIEWKIEEQYAEGKDKDEVPIVEFRKDAANSPIRGSTSSAMSSNVLASWAIGTSLYDDGLRSGGKDRIGDRPVLNEWRSVSRLQAGAVVGCRKNGIGGSRSRIFGAQVDDPVRPVPHCADQGP